MSFEAAVTCPRNRKNSIQNFSVAASGGWRLLALPVISSGGTARTLTRLSTANADSAEPCSRLEILSAASIRARSWMQHTSLSERMHHATALHREAIRHQPVSWRSGVTHHGGALLHLLVHRLTDRELCPFRLGCSGTSSHRVHSHKPGLPARAATTFKLAAVVTRVHCNSLEYVLVCNCNIGQNGVRPRFVRHSCAARYVRGSHFKDYVPITAYYQENCVKCGHSRVLRWAPNARGYAVRRNLLSCQPRTSR